MAVISALPVEFCQPWFTTEPQLHSWDGSAVDVDGDEADEPASSR